MTAAFDSEGGGEVTTEPTVTIPLALLERAIEAVKELDAIFSFHRRGSLPVTNQLIADLEAVKATEVKAIEYVMPPDGTSLGCRDRDGSMWIKCQPEPDKKPGIAICSYAGNWVNPPCYELVSVFEKESDRDFVLELHKAHVTARSMATNNARDGQKE